MARNKKVEILSNDKEVLHPMTDGDCVIFEDGQTLTQKLSEDDSVKYTPEIVNSSPMFKVGEGNTVDYSDNVLDGAYERATLQGQTYVNYIQESSADEVTLPTPFTEYERTQHNTLTSDEEGVLGINLVGQSYVNALQHDSEEEFVVLGESLEFQEKKVEYTNEGQIKSAMLKGQTLVNLGQPQIGLHNNGYSYQGNASACVDYDEYIRYIPNGENNLCPCIRLHLTEANGNRFSTKQPLKTNTKYIVFVKLNVQSAAVSKLRVSTTGYNNDGEVGSVVLSQGLQVAKAIFTTPTEFTNHLCVGTDLYWTQGQYVDLYWYQLFEYQDGMENWDIPYFEGMQSVTVSTRLENVCSRYNSSSAKNGKTFTVGTWENRGLTLSTTDNIAKYNFKPNTKYLVQFKVTNLNLDGLSSISIAFSDGEISTGNSLFGDNAVVEVKSNGIHRGILTTSNVIPTSNFVIKGLKNQWEGSGSSLRSMTISEIMCVEYQNGMENWNLPYFEDYQVMKPVQVETTNRNLFDISKSNKPYHCDMVAHNSSSFTLTGTGTAQYKNVSFEINVKPNTNYYIQVSGEVVSGNPNPTFDIYSMDNKYLYGGQVTKFNSGDNTRLSFRFYVNVNNSNTGSVKYTVQLEESSTTTEYVPHQSKTTYSWDEVILRKIGDVEDTLDLTTGEWVQRIGEINSNEMTITSISNGNNMLGGTDYCNALTVKLPNAINANGYELINQELYVKSDKKTCLDRGDTNWHLPSNVGKIVKHTSVNYKEDLWVIVPTDIATSELAIDYLKDNPFTVQYVLATPIVHKVNLSRPNLQVYDDITHVHTKCLDGTLIPNIYLPSDISYPAILKPGKAYNVCVNHTEVSADNPLKVNVGGTEITMTDSRMTLTTPTTLANSNVSFTGKGNKIKESMLIKNSSLLTRDLPHFNGIGSVQLGKTIENLCSGRYIKGGSAQATLTDALDTVKITTTTQGSYVLEFPILTPLENGKTYFVYAPVSGGGWATYSFVRTYNNSKSYLRQPMGEMMNPQQYIVTIDQSDNQYVSLCIGCHGAISVGTTYTITRPILCEYEQGMENWDWESIGYFTGTKNIGNEFMRVQNKNFYPYGDSSFTGQQGNMWCWLNGKGCSFGKNCVKKNMGNAFYLKKGSYVLSYNDNNSFQTNSIQLVGEYEKIVNLNNIKQDGWYAIRVKTTTDNIPVNITNIQLEESSTATTYTAHKHNGLYITKDQPIELTWEQGNVNAGANTSWNDVIQNTVSKRIRTNLITLKPNTSYRVSLGNKNYMWYMYAFDGNNVCPQPHSFNMKPDGFMQTDFIFTTTQQLYKIALVGRKVDDTNITPSEINHIRLEEVTDVVLRGIGDVHDELDITRGVYIQHIENYTITGNEDFYCDTTYTEDNTIYCRVCMPVNRVYNTHMLHNKQNVAPICNQFIGKEWSSKGEYKNILIGGSYDLHFIVKQAELSSLDNNGCKKYFKDLYDSGNPVIVQYQLETPIVHKVHIGNKNEANTEVTKPNDVFTLPTLYTEQTHIDLTNNGIVPKVQSRDYIAYPVLPMIGRTYTLQHNLTGGVSNLTVDLLGRTQSVSYQNHKSLIYSPETMDAILHNELRISGKGKISGVMYIDGGYMDRDIPYIEGMKNAVNPIVKNIGKNLISFDNMYSRYIAYGSLSCVNNTITRLKDGYNEMQLYIYLVNGKHYYFGLDGSIGVGGVQQPKIILGKMRGWEGLSEQQKIAPNQDFIYRGQTGWVTLHIVNIDYINDIYITEVQGHENCEPYKENICYVGSWVISYESMIKNQSVTGDTGQVINNGEYRYSTDYIEITTPRIFINSKDSHYVFVYDKDKKYIGRYPENWSTSSYHDFDVAEGYFKVVFNHTNKKPDVYTYIASEEQIFYLRSLPNGVHDEIDLETGKYIQRVGEIVLDGSSDEQYFGFTIEPSTLLRGIYLIPNIKMTSNFECNFMCDSIPSVVYGNSWNIPYKCFAPYYSTSGSGILIYLPVQNETEFKQYLQQNSITVQYELVEPIVKDVVIHNYPHSYEGGHVIIESGDPNTPITAQLAYRAVTNRSGQIQQHTEQVEKQEREINELETLILANIHLSQTR